jgi:hypothetical protein
MSWDNKSKGLVQIYRRYAGMPDPVYRDRLHQCTGARSSRDQHLCGAHFEAFMPLMESAAHLAETNGMAVGRKPRKIQDWYYWRNRYRAPGLATHAQLHAITDLWAQFIPYLPESERSDQYLMGIAIHATGSKIAALHSLRSHQAGLLIDALKDRMRYAIRRAG